MGSATSGAMPQPSKLQQPRHELGAGGVAGLRAMCARIDPRLMRLAQATIDDLRVVAESDQGAAGWLTAQGKED